MVQPRSFNYTINYLIDFEQLFKNDHEIYERKYCINDTINLELLKSVGKSFFFVCSKQEVARFIRLTTYNGSIEICEFLAFGKNSTFEENENKNLGKKKNFLMSFLFFLFFLFYFSSYCSPLFIFYKKVMKY